MLRGRLGRGVPREAARETDSAAESPKGDVFGPETVALGRSRDCSGRRMPRQAPRGTYLSRMTPRGRRACLQGSFALVTSRDRQAHGVPQNVARGRGPAAERRKGDARRTKLVALGRSRDCSGRRMPRETSRVTDSAAERPEGDVFGPETFALGAFSRPPMRARRSLGRIPAS